MKKILFSDLDGTIVHYNEPMNLKDVEAVKRLREHGHIFVINTGRNIQETSLILPYFDYDYMILNNGAMIVDNEEHVLHHQTIQNHIGKEIFTYCFKHFPHLCYTFYAGDATYFYDVERKKTRVLTPDDYVDIDGSFHEIFFNETKDYEILCAFNPNGETKEIKEIQEYIKENYPGIQGTVNTMYLDITVDHCSKGTGLLKLCELLDEELETYCVGDSYNDFSQFEVADHPYTFHRVDDEIKEKTEKQVDYVYELIDDMLS